MREPLPSYRSHKDTKMPTDRLQLILLPVLLATLLGALPALATDGVLEINQTCAVETGCFSGDTAGFPVTVDGSVGRSVRLTSDLIIPDENTDGIRIGTSDVGIDLNNFAIIRSGCEGVTTDCTPASGVGSGVETTFSSLAGLSVKNGSVTGMGFYGVQLGRQAEVTNVRVRWNRIGGIWASTGSTVSGNTAYQNGDDGIFVGPGSTVSGNTASSNRGDGIRASFGSTVSGNTAGSNDGNGISFLSGAAGTVIGNTLSNNQLDGIRLPSTSGCTILNNTVNGSFTPLGSGIRAAAGCNIRGNTIYGVGGAGILAGVESIIKDNVVSSSAEAGIVASTSATVIGNSSNSNGGDGIFVGNASTVRNNTSNLNAGDGIEAGTGSNVSGNSARSNDDFGLRSESNSVGFRENIFGNNNGGTGAAQTSSGSNLGSNLCDNSTVCP